MFLQLLWKFFVNFRLLPIDFELDFTFFSMIFTRNGQKVCRDNEPPPPGRTLPTAGPCPYREVDFKDDKDFKDGTQIN